MTKDVAGTRRGQRLGDNLAMIYVKREADAACSGTVQISLPRYWWRYSIGIASARTVPTEYATGHGSTNREGGIAIDAGQQDSIDARGYEVSPSLLSFCPYLSWI